MANYKYLIVGGGMTADAAVRGIREVDPDGSIGMIAAEPHPPYNRPPLSKGLWKDKRVESIWRGAANNEAIMHLGREAKTLEPAQKRVTDDRGAEYHYQELLLATGATPKRLPINDAAVVYFRTLDDYHHLRALAEQGNDFVVIGGGFIGSEIAAVLAMNGKRVTMVFPDEGVGGSRFPRDLALFLNDFYRQHGVEVLAGDVVTDIRLQGDRAAVTTQRGRTLLADGIVAGIGVEPNVQLAREAGLTVEDGIAVNAALCTSHPDIFAAGDVASFFNPALGQRIRVEHEDNANTMGELAGQSMAGKAVRYDHLPFFYSDLFELGYEAVGDLNWRLETVADWKEPFREGTVYYLRDGRVRGVLLWNVWGRVDAARELIASPGPFRREDLLERIHA